MKKFFYFIMIMLSVAMVSCQKQDIRTENNQMNSNNNDLENYETVSLSGAGSVSGSMKALSIVNEGDVRTPSKIDFNTNTWNKNNKPKVIILCKTGSTNNIKIVEDDNVNIDKSKVSFRTEIQIPKDSDPSIMIYVSDKDMVDEDTKNNGIIKLRDVNPIDLYPLNTPKSINNKYKILFGTPMAQKLSALKENDGAKLQSLRFNPVGTMITFAFKNITPATSVSSLNVSKAGICLNNLLFETTVDIKNKIRLSDIDFTYGLNPSQGDSQYEGRAPEDIRDASRTIYRPWSAPSKQALTFNIKDQNTIGSNTTGDKVYAIYCFSTFESESKHLPSNNEYSIGVLLGGLRKFYNLNKTNHKSSFAMSKNYGLIAKFEGPVGLNDTDYFITRWNTKENGQIRFQLQPAGATHNNAKLQQVRSKNTEGGHKTRVEYRKLNSDGRTWGEWTSYQQNVEPRDEIIDYSINNLDPNSIYQVRISKPDEFKLRKETRDNIISVDQWGTGYFYGFSYGFSNSTSLEKINAVDHPLFPEGQGKFDASYMFQGCTNLGDCQLDSWDLSNIQSAASMFEDCEKFDSDLSDWNVSGIKQATRMFKNCKKFNSDLSRWNISSMTSTMELFMFCKEFNSDISNWDMSHIEIADRMLLGASNFNQDLSNWNLRSLGKAEQMIDYAGFSYQNLYNTLFHWTNGDKWKVPNSGTVFTLFGYQHLIDVKPKGRELNKVVDLFAALINEKKWNFFYNKDGNYNGETSYIDKAPNGEAQIYHGDGKIYNSGNVNELR